jgi:hypothetical protein
MLGFALTLAAFWPGYLSFDSALQWWEARQGQYSNVHPPAMAMLWSLSERFVSGAGPLLALFAALHWSAIALLAQRVRAPAPVVLGVVWIVGFWPPLFALLPHVWKDVAVMTLFGFAVAALAQSAAATTRAHRRWVASALLALAFGCAMRHNAATALPPLLAYLAWQMLRRRDLAARPWRVGLLAVVGSIVLALVAQIPERLASVQRLPSWPAVAAWDLAAVSVREQRVLLPEAVLFLPADPLPLLTEHYTPATNVPTLVSGGIRSSFLFPYSDATYAELRQRWLALPWQHTHAYFAHRGEMMALLLRWHTDPLADSLVLMPGQVSYRDNPTPAPRSDALNRVLQSGLDRLVATPLFSGWLYLLACAALFAIGWRRGDARARLAAATALSGLCYALPLAVASGGAEVRYLSWLFAATLLATLLLLPVGVRPRSGVRLADSHDDTSGLT